MKTIYSIIRNTATGLAALASLSCASITRPDQLSILKSQYQCVTEAPIKPGKNSFLQESRAANEVRDALRQCYELNFGKLPSDFAQRMKIIPDRESNRFIGYVAKSN